MNSIALGKPFSTLSREMLSIRFASEFTNDKYSILHIENKNKSSEFIQSHAHQDFSRSVDKVSVPIENVSGLIEIYERIIRSSSAWGNVTQSLATSIMIKWDEFLANLIRAILASKPELMVLTDKDITVKEIMKAETLEDVRANIAEQYIDSAMRGSISDRVSHVQKITNCDFSVISELSDVYEAYERRNVIVHASSIATEQYVTSCKKNKLRSVEHIKVGDKLAVDHDYISKITSSCIVAGLMMSQIVMRKLYEKTDSSYANESLIQISYEMIKCGDYEDAKNIIESFMAKGLGSSDSRSKLYLTINLAQSYKWMGKQGKCEDIIGKVEWDITSNIFKMAVAVLRDDFDICRNYMRSIAELNEIQKETYYLWPLFKEFIKSDVFLETYKEIYGSTTTINHRAANLEGGGNSATSIFDDRDIFG